VDALLALDDRERRTRRLEARADRDDALDADLARTRDGRDRIVERIEVRVRIDHSPSSRARTSSASSFANNGRGSRSS
jgi:hypothetical protein